MLLDGAGAGGEAGADLFARRATGQVGAGIGRGDDGNDGKGSKDEEQFAHGILPGCAVAGVISQISIL